MEKLIPYRQGDDRWKTLRLGGSSFKMSTHGCYVCALSTIEGHTPDVILEKLNNSQCFTKEGLLKNEKAARALGLVWGGILYPPLTPQYPAIVETNYYKNKGIPQHFFVMTEEDRIIDPIDGLEKDLPYKIVSYRLFSRPKDVYPARPPDSEKPPCNDAQSRYEELEAQKAGPALKLTPWEALWLWLRKCFHFWG